MRSFCNGESSAGFAFHTASPDSSYTWANSNIKIGLPASGTGNISRFIATNNSSLPVLDTITVNAIVKAGAATCPAGPPRTFTITVNPSPLRPGFTSLSGSPDKPAGYAVTEGLSLCKGARNINFNVTAADTGTRYVWSATIIKGLSPTIRRDTSANTVISFDSSAGEYRIRVTAVAPATGCIDSVSQYVQVKTDSIHANDRIFLMQPGNLLVYPDNSLNKYQWGYDSILAPLVFGPPKVFPGQVRQFLFLLLHWK